MLPTDLPGEQSGNGGFPTAHESDQADEFSYADLIRHWYQNCVRCGMEQSITLANVDCTIEGHQFDLGVASIECPEKTVAELGMGALWVDRRRQSRLVVDGAL